MKKISLKSHGDAVTSSDNNLGDDFSGISLIEKVGPSFLRFNPCQSLPYGVATEDRKQFYSNMVN